MSKNNHWNNDTPSDKDILKKTVLCLIATRAIIFLTAVISLEIVPKGEFFIGGAKDILGAFFRWDSNWFMSVITKGYWFDPAIPSNINFFPVFPLVTKALSFFTGNIIGIMESGYLVSNLSLLFAGFFLYKLVQMEFNSKDISDKTLFLFFISPMSFFFSIFYSEGIFLFFIITSFYFARKKECGKAGVLGFLAALTRAPGIFIVIPLMLEYFTGKNGRFEFRIEKIRKNMLFIFLVPIATLIYFAYLFLEFHDPFAYQKNMMHWSMWLATPIHTIINSFGHSSGYQFIFLSAIIIAIILAVVIYKVRLRPSYLIYSETLILFHLSTNIPDSLPRYLSVIFPIYIALVLVSQKHDIIYKGLVAASVIGLITFTALFVNGYWIV